ncbi:ribonuclease HI [Oerskovia flava]|uniref:ribonuclease HI n=1 Tax=Oerskovia flava TaxID=2986422 RepID=UPI00223EFEBC|nr:ribonuclease HI [Oerskovia sp. JB1-3-2]
MSRTRAWTDGACKGNPGPGGWGVLIRDGHDTVELSGGEPSTTNNRMELLAAIRALQALADGTQVALYTDSAYVMNGMRSWIAGWKRRGWTTAAGQPVKNMDLWRELDQQVAHHDVQWTWVKGHSGDPGNERADALANVGCAPYRRRD